MKLIFLIFFPFITLCQQESRLDSFAVNIPDSMTFSPNNFAYYIGSNFKNDSEKVRVLYVWVTTKIKYEEKITDSLRNQDLVSYVLKTRSGKCKNYSALLTSVCDLMNIEAYSVLGYTRIDRKIDTSYDHAWNIIKLDNEYFLFDPTWDSKQKQYNSIKQEYEYLYYKKNSNYFIKTHMPYDPVMQLKNYPVSHRDFFQNKQNGKIYIDFKKSISEYYQLTEYEKLQAMLKRAEENGIGISELRGLYSKLKYFISITNKN